MLVVRAVEANGLEACLAQHRHGAPLGIVKLEVRRERVRSALAHDRTRQHRRACLGIDLDTTDAHRYEGELGGEFTVLCQRQQRNEHLESAIQNARMHV